MLIFSFLKYGLKGLYTGMIISDYTEAQYESVNATYHEIDESLFAKAIKNGVDNEDVLKEVQKHYVSENLNRVINFNETRI
jgi:hypothetical protein